MSKGRRYDNEPKLNYKKVFGVILALVVLIMMIATIVNLIRGEQDSDRGRDISFYSSYYSRKMGSN